MAAFLTFLIVWSSLVWLSCCVGGTVEYDSKAIIINGQRKLILSGSIHYPRSTPQMWPDLIQKAKDGGLDAIETYIFWNAHEPARRQYDFQGNLDFIQFFKLVRKAGMYGILRIGPYACAEWNYGGLPVWLHNMPGIKLRTDNEIYKNEMQTFTSKIVKMVKDAELFASQGGPIILSQIENEYGNVMGPYGKAGVAYMQWCARMAVSLDIGVPWLMCQQPNAPPSVINTCNGFYCDRFTPNNPKSPKIWTENWTGWFKAWGELTPHRPAEDLAFSVARFFQKGGVLQNYYMYHGGTNFGRTSGGPFIATTYDYDAPLDEYGYQNQPKWGHLKSLHAAIKSGEKILTNYDQVVTTKYSGGWVELTKFSINATGENICFLSNTKTKDIPLDFLIDGIPNVTVPAWSVSILQDCSEDIYNTAMVNVPAAVNLKMPPTNYENQSLSWFWTAEPIVKKLEGFGSFSARQLIDQKTAAADQSDYLWYMTSFEYGGNVSTNMVLKVNSSGQILYAYVNGELLGDQWSNNFTFQSPVVIKPGTNNITLLSGTVGLQNYGSFFDEQPDGISGGPVQLVSGSTKFDLSNNQWKYAVGLTGEAQRFFDPKSENVEWKPIDNLNSTTGMTWYKASFENPAGSEAVVVDMAGMGKGEVWVNGRSIGRFWPTRIAKLNGCGHCDYRGEYKTSNCVTNCGEPSQRWYHVPREFLKKENNVIVAFEEMGGSLAYVAFRVIAR